MRRKRLEGRSAGSGRTNDGGQRWLETTWWAIRAEIHSKRNKGRHEQTHNDVEGLQNETREIRCHIARYAIILWFGDVLL